MGSVVDKAVEWAVSIANDESHGYSQYNRWGPDYDCSSLVITAYEKAGVPVKSKYGAERTTNMKSTFKKAGFVDVTAQINLKTGKGLKKGDVLWRKGHTEMMCTSKKRVGAHIAETGGVHGEKGDQTGKEICIYNYSGDWTTVLRYPEIVTDEDSTKPPITKNEIINSNSYLSVSQMYNNAMYIASYFYQHGWTINAIAAILGNMQTESNMNPGIWESLDEGNTEGGFGLVQWTPATKLINWCDSLHLSYKDIDAQLARILYEMDNGLQYYPTDNYPETFKEFSTSTKSCEYLAGAFLYNYERPKSPNTEKRGEQARYWYYILAETDPDWLMGVPAKKKGMSLLLMYMATRRRF